MVRTPTTGESATIIRWVNYKLILQVNFQSILLYKLETDMNEYILTKKYLSHRRIYIIQRIPTC